MGTLVFSSTRADNLHDEIVAVDPARPGRRRNLSRHPAADREAAVSPNGRMIAFVSERGGGQALWTMTTAGRELTRVTKRYRMIDTAARLHAPRWSPDGARLLYEVVATGVTTFFVVPARGGSEQAIARGIDVAWAPDSRRVALTEPLSGGGTEAAVSVRDLRGRVLSRRAGFLVGWSARGDLATTWRGRIVVERTTGSRIRVQGSGPGWWSPDGRRLAFPRADGIWLLGTSGPPRRLVAERGAGSWLSWAPDGRSFLYYDRRGTAMLLTLRGRPRRLAHAAVGASWSWSRDGRIAFGLESLFVVRPGERPRLLDRGTGGTCPVRFSSLAWLADGRVLVVRGRNGGHQADLWRSDGSGSAPRRFLGDADHWESAPVWSPDGDRVVYEHGLPHTREGACAGISEPSLWIAGADGRGARRLVNRERHYDFAPVWSPDGSRVAFLRDSFLSGSLGIHVVEVASGRVHRVTESGSDGVPSWSPNGQQLAFSRARRIHVVRADGTGMRRLAAGDTPVWSPTGSRIAYLRRGRVWTVASDGSGARPLAPAIGAPVWSPDGRRIAVTTGGRLVVVTPGRTERTILRGRDIHDISWSPDNRWLSYVATAPPDGRSELFRVSAAGGRPTQLTRDLALVGRAAWRP